MKTIIYSMENYLSEYFFRASVWGAADISEQNNTSFQT